MTAGPAALTLHLVRHGQSEWNRLGRLQGQTPHPALSDLGHRQARAAATVLASGLGGPPVDAVLTSDLVRAVQTAQPIAAALGLIPISEPRLREQGMGRLEGLSSADAFAATADADWSDPDVRLGGTDSESRQDVYRRVGGVLAELLATQLAAPEPRTVVLVSHGDTIRIAAQWLAQTSSEPFGADELAVANGSIITARLVEGVLSSLMTVIPPLVPPVG